MTQNKVGRVLKEIRGDKSQQQFAFELGVVRETVSKYEGLSDYVVENRFEHFTKIPNITQ